MDNETSKTNNLNNEFIAHVRKFDGLKQPLHVHLAEVAQISKKLAEKINAPLAGELIGLIHDFGKYSQAFQIYIKSATGLLNPDIDDEYVDAKGLKGRIDHSTAGAQWIYHQLKNYGKRGEGQLIAQILALCVASHHSGLINCLDDHATKPNAFLRRINDKLEEDSHLAECIAQAEGIIKKANQIIANGLVKETYYSMQPIIKQWANSNINYIDEFYLGCFTRFLFSCLIDADRINSADFERPQNQEWRSQSLPDWSVAVNKLEQVLTDFKQENEIDHIRQDISDQCLQRANDQQGIYTLSVPTGGGKTLASLRYALHHAKTHQLERIIYIIPYTSIIEQNAQVADHILGLQENQKPWVLEHHSNLEPEQQTWTSKLITDNWDSPIIFTTMVQFLETCFGAGTRGVRRLHQLANSVLIFDEVQTLPINCVHLFCNQLNFLNQLAGTTAILCTATQPLLHDLPEKLKKFGETHLSANAEIIGDTVAVDRLFELLERVTVIDRRQVAGWTAQALNQLILEQYRQAGSCLVIVNTKAWAQQLYQDCIASGLGDNQVFHLSTNQCAAHRKDILDEVKTKLERNEHIVCISTQLIEAGVDVSFNTVIRFLAGLDSIAQAAGRCNRHGNLKNDEGKIAKGTVLIINPDQETTDLLEDIEKGKQASARILDEIVNTKENILSPAVMSRYFDYYFYSHSNETEYEKSHKMAYPIKDQLGASNNLINLLSVNHGHCLNKNVERKNMGKMPVLQQSFMSAAKAFKAIDAPTQAVIVPYGEKGREIINILNTGAKADFQTFYTALRRAQKYSVNVFPNTWKKLVNAQIALHEIEETGVFILDQRFYSDDFGVTTQEVNAMETMVF